jgi:hypothetical protein
MRGILNKIRSPLAALGLLMALMQPTWSAGLPVPAGKVLLKVDGEIERTNVGGAAVFDLSLLSSLGVEPLRTVTAWTEGEQLFEGVPLRRVLDAVGARGTRLRAVALNDYESILALDDPAAAHAFLAFKRNGDPMRVRDKGPLWIVFPWSEHPELVTERIRTWAVWQLTRLEVLSP